MTASTPVRRRKGHGVGRPAGWHLGKGLLHKRGGRHGPVSPILSTGRAPRATVLGSAMIQAARLEWGGGRRREEAWGCGLGRSGDWGLAMRRGARGSRGRRLMRGRPCISSADSCCILPYKASSGRHNGTAPMCTQGETPYITGTMVTITAPTKPELCLILCLGLLPIITWLQRCPPLS
jgi:hypothetical protein